jgi:two-component system, OmpR family, phosphate regulon sensor histidine kinase PhoR
MKLTRKTVGLLILLVFASLVGLVGLQIYLLKDAYDQRDAAFRQSVGVVLAGVNSGLERSEVLGRVFNAHTPAGKGNRAMIAMHAEVSSEGPVGKRLVDTTMFGHVAPLSVSGSQVTYSVGSPQRVAVRVFDLTGREDTTLVDTFVQAGSYNVALNPRKYSGGDYYYRYTADSNTVTLRVVHGKSGGTVSHGTVDVNMVEDVVSRVVMAGGPAENRRIEPAMLDSLLTSHMKDAGILEPFTYGVLATRPDTLQLISHREQSGQVKQSPYRARLFPGDIFQPASELVLYFPDHTYFLLRSMAPLIGATVLFTAGIIFAFLYTLRTIVRQKRLSESLVDFINNMTHEFKTPLSTIALASEAIARPDVLSDREKIVQYNGIILDENMRMKKQVDKILQMAVLEEGDYELKMEVVDVHEIIRKSVEAFALQVDGKGGKLETLLNAGTAVVRADALHLTNVINNLLDNANKYSPESPDISVATSNTDGHLIITIRDRGMGMSPEDARRAFDRYFRVPKGNRHDVKGFGLGLTYVKMIVEAHGGNVALEGVPEVGTTVTVSLPLASMAEGAEQ